LRAYSVPFVSRQRYPPESALWASAACAIGGGFAATVVLVEALASTIALCSDASSLLSKQDIEASPASTFFTPEKSGSALA
jgi:hypothetical protein